MCVPWLPQCMYVERVSEHFIKDSLMPSKMPVGRVARHTDSALPCCLAKQRKHRRGASVRSRATRDGTRPVPERCRKNLPIGYIRRGDRGPPQRSRLQPLTGGRGSTGLVGGPPPTPRTARGAPPPRGPARTATPPPTPRPASGGRAAPRPAPPGRPPAAAPDWPLSLLAPGWAVGWDAHPRTYTIHIYAHTHIPAHTYTHTHDTHVHWGLLGGQPAQAKAHHRHHLGADQQPDGAHVAVPGVPADAGEVHAALPRRDAVDLRHRDQRAGHSRGRGRSQHSNTKEQVSGENEPRHTRF